MRELEEIDSEPTDDPDPLPDGTAHVIVLSPKGVIEPAKLRAERTGDDDANAVLHEPGDELPEMVAKRVWDGFSDVLAALDTNGERLDSSGRGERSNDLDAESPLRKWRAENGLTRRTVRLFECEECGERFDTKDGLNGHMQVHRRGDGDDSGPESETLADKLDGDAGGESA